MASVTRFTIDPARVVSETLEGETMAINMENGNYYAFNETGSVLWHLIETGYSQSDIVRYFASHYEAAPEILEKSINESIAFLLHDNLLSESSEKGEEHSMEHEEAVKKPFVSIAIDRHEDMQDMLLADPIHDVDASGWPTLKQ